MRRLRLRLTFDIFLRDKREESEPEINTYAVASTYVSPPDEPEDDDEDDYEDRIGFQIPRRR